MSNGKICNECGSTPCNDECSAITITESQIQSVFEYWKDCDSGKKDSTPLSDEHYAEQSAKYFLKIYKEIFTDDKVPT